jgi:hypothetical protein
MQTIGYTSVQRHKAFRGFVPEHRYQVHSAEGRKAWELQHYAELEALLLKWQQALSILIKSQVFTDGVYDFFASRKFYKGFDQARLSEILLYLENRFGAYLRKDITQVERDILRSVHKDIYHGVVVNGVRIFPEVYYPYMDKLYFDHANWNRVPKGVGIADVLEHKEKYIITNVHSLHSQGVEEKSEGGCGCTGSDCGCKSNQNFNELSNPTSIHGIQRVSVKDFEAYKKIVLSNIIFIGYSVHSGFEMPRLAADCYCTRPSIDNLYSHSFCSQYGGAGYCGKCATVGPLMLCSGATLDTLIPK